MMDAEGVILDAIEAATGERPIARGSIPISGGCIHHAFRLGDFFVKTNRASRAPMFEAEATGLRALAETKTVRVPEIVCAGVGQGTAHLVLEYLELGSSPARSQEQLGQELAALHRWRGDTFGFSSDNYIGATPQPNAPGPEWIPFLREQRLGYLARRLAEGGQPVAGMEDLLDSLEKFFDRHQPPPSLLHGDLWAGNAGALADGTPVIYDPAVYYGDREADLAMTELFGGFSPRFYQAYEEAWPLHPGYAQRKELYKLYHILNHALLFGGGYHSQAAAMVRGML